MSKPGKFPAKRTLSCFFPLLDITGYRFPIPKNIYWWKIFYSQSLGKAKNVRFLATDISLDSCNF